MNYITYRKLCKKLRRQEDLKHRVTWNEICPVTRRAESKRAYSRARMKQEVRMML